MHKITPETNGQTFIRLHQSRQLQRRADALTSFRRKYAHHAGALVALTKPNVPVALTTAGMWWTDFQDGRSAKRAQELANTTEPLSDGHEEDPIADKKWFRAVLAGIGVRALLAGDTKTAVVTGSVAAAEYIRNKHMEEQRNAVKEEQLDLSTAAIQTNRYKTAGHAVFSTILASHLSDNETVKNVALVGLAASTVLGFVGAAQYGSMVINARSTRELENAARCPDEVDTYYSTQPQIDIA